MSMQALRDNIGEYAKDIRLNLGSVLSEEGAPGLSKIQIWGSALASAYATRNPDVIDAIRTDAEAELSAEYLEATKAAATIMAMNNVYYRSLHLAEDPELSKLPARLRMNVIGKPGIEKVDFELFSLAVSALSGCANCIKAHMQEVKKAGISVEGIQSSIRIASVINAAAQAKAIG